MSEVCKDPWDATFIDEIGEDRQMLYDLIRVSRSTTSSCYVCVSDRRGSNTKMLIVCCICYFLFASLGHELHGCEEFASPRLFESGFSH